jgi:hypothetical protein
MAQAIEERKEENQVCGGSTKINHVSVFRKIWEKITKK